MHRFRKINNNKCKMENSPMNDNNHNKEIEVTITDQNGNPVKKKGVKVSVLNSYEAWSTANLEDGSTVRYKSSIIDAIRVTDEFDQNGNPIYLINQTGIINVESPNKLKRK